jgi:hypothetical protein
MVIVYLQFRLHGPERRNALNAVMDFRAFRTFTVMLERMNMLR